MKQKRFTADYPGTEAAGSGSQDCRPVSPGGHYATDILSLEGQVRRHEGFRRQTAEGVGSREPQAQAAFGGDATGKVGSEGTRGKALVGTAQRCRVARYLV